jgi:uncharacterized protein YcgL (UPF0745 family)
MDTEKLMKVLENLNEMCGNNSKSIMLLLDITKQLANELNEIKEKLNETRA